MPERSAYDVLQVAASAHDAVLRAAYRALAALYHPDSDPSPGAARRMAEINDAYAKVRTLDRRALYDRSLALQATASQRVAQYSSSSHNGADRKAPSDRSILDFGRYQGWSLMQLSRHDPDYLRWLSRHSSGIRYRRQIQALLNDQEQPAAPERRKRR